MYGFTPWQWLIIIHGTLAIIPALVLLRQYLHTFMNDYLIFMGVFMSIPIVSFSHIFAGISEKVIFPQLTFWLLSFLFLMLFLHGVRIVWIKPHPIIWYTGIIWFFLLVLLISFWEFMPDQPDRASVFFWEMSFNQYDHHPKGAGISTSSGIFILTTRYAILFWLYGIYSISIVLYAYFTIDFIHPTKEIIKARNLLIFAYIIFLIWIIIIILPIGTNIEYINVLSSLSLFIVAYVSIFIPEAMLISHVQILRAIDLYDRFKTLPSKERTSIGLESLIKYLSSIPDELIKGKKID